MSEYLVETYVSGGATFESMPRLDELSRVADELTGEGQRVRLTRTIWVPEDETGFYLFEAPSPGPILELADRVGLRVDRLVEALSI